jgi:aryl-alcohol dehydrogenase-like predicted oxidoreductase
MRYRRFGRTGWQVSEIGYGMWGMAGWSGSDDAESLESLQRAVDLGVNFFDTAWAYGEGHSEHLLGELVRANPEKRIYTASKIPPKNRKWPASEGLSLEDSYPADHIEEYVHSSLKNSGLESFDVMQLHTWRDDWLEQGDPLAKLEELKRQGLIHSAGLSLNRWEPWNGVRAVRTGRVDAVQVIYNIFDQNPEDELFPACKEFDVAVIARVPFDEGSLTGTLTKQSKWPEGDWRNTYFVAENLNETVDRVGALLPVAADAEMPLPEMALRFILSNETVSTIIPGMRKLRNVDANTAASDAGPLSAETLDQLRAHKWLRKPKPWSQ